MQTKSQLKLEERMYPDVHTSRVLKDHIARYEFACQFVDKKIVADIGCGEGYGSAKIKDAGAQEVIALDLAPDVIQRAHEKYSGINFMTGDATATALAGASVDVVILFEVWHHLDNFKNVVAEIGRILRPGGLLLCSVPNKHVIYLNPLHKKMLTEFYRHDFDRNEITKFLGDDFKVRSWFGQRFVSSFWVNPVVRLVLYVCSRFVPLLENKINIKYKLANGPQVLPIQGRMSPRTIIFVAQRANS